MGFWDTVASAGPYANNLHLASDRQSHQHLIAQIFTGRMLFPTPNQQCQSTEGIISHKPTLFFSSSAVIDFVLSSLTSRSLCSFSSPISLLSSERSCSHSPACSCFAPHTHSQRVCCVVVLSHVIGELRYGPLGRGFGGSECRRRVIG